jgi:hypothetical protein
MSTVYQRLCHRTEPLIYWRYGCHVRMEVWRSCRLRAAEVLRSGRRAGTEVWKSCRSGGLEVWGSGDLEVWRSWRSGDLEIVEVWRSCRYGAAEIWRPEGMEIVRHGGEVWRSGGRVGIEVWMACRHVSRECAPPWWQCFRYVPTRGRSPANWAGDRLAYGQSCTKLAIRLIPPNFRQATTGYNCPSPKINSINSNEDFV